HEQHAERSDCDRELQRRPFGSALPRRGRRYSSLAGLLRCAAAISTILEEEYMARLEITTGVERRSVARKLAQTAAAALLAAALAGPAAAQQSAQSKIEHIKVLSPSIEGNLQGNSAERDVLVYLPPSYSTET